jgi:tetratricopeptide (TPR) repeat protein
LAREKPERALALGELAKQLDPHLPTPFFFISRVIASQDQNKVVTIAGEYLEGWWETIRHFWFLFFALQSILTLVVVAFLATVATVISSTIVFYCPLWLHEWRERTGNLLRGWVLLPLIFWLLFLLPIWSQGLFWGLIACTFLFWSYYSRKEKLVVYTFIVFIGFSFLFLPYLISFRAAKGSLLLNHMVKNQRHEGSTYLPNMSSILKEAPDSWIPYFIFAGIHSSHGDNDKALELYMKASELQPASPLILNNLGNAYYYLKSYDKAIESYQAAQRADPQYVLPVYNMSQAYREKLMFEEGEKQYKNAEKLNQKLTEAYTRITTENPSHPVVDGRLGMGVLWQKAIDPKHGKNQAEIVWKVLFGPLPIKNSPILAIGWVIALILGKGMRSQVKPPIFCQSCRRAICYRCQRQIFDYKVCKTCWNHLKTIRKRTEVTPYIRPVNHNYKIGLILCILPGGGQLYLKETIKGAIILGIFFLVLGYEFFGGIFHPNLMWHLDDQRALWIPIVLGLLYLVSLLDIWRVRSWRVI